MAAPALVLLACSSDGGGLQIGQIGLPSSETVAAITPKLVQAPQGSATEIYERVAKGANACWFGPNGPLKNDYIYHAEADAPSRGGKAEIVIHKRDPSQPNPRGAKSYRVNIDPTGESSATVKTENLHMADDYAAAMSADVGRWASGEPNCAANSTVAGWGAEAAPAPETPSVKKGAKSTRTAKVKSASSAVKP